MRRLIRRLCRRRDASALMRSWRVEVGIAYDDWRELFARQPDYLRHFEIRIPVSRDRELRDSPPPVVWLVSDCLAKDSFNAIKGAELEVEYALGVSPLMTMVNPIEETAS